MRHVVLLVLCFGSLLASRASAFTDWYVDGNNPNCPGSGRLTKDSVDLNQIKEALRHASISTTLTYARLGEDPGRDAMESHGERIMEVAGNVRPVNGGGV